MDAFIFDMDGTIFDTESFYYKTWLNISKKYGFDFNLNDKMALSGRQNKEAVAYMVENFSISYEDAISLRKELNDLRDEKFKEIDYSLKKDGLIELLDYLKAHNKKIGLATSSEKRRVDFLFDREGVRDYFDNIVLSEDIVKGKPDPEIFNLSMEKLNADKNRTYILEDSLSGIRAAKKSGAVACLILDLDKSELIKSEADLVFNSLYEFLDYIKEKENIDTSRMKDFKLYCPVCKKSFDAKFPTAILKNSSNFSLIEDKSLGLIKCPSCKNEFKLNYRYVFTDSDKKLMFVNDPKFNKKISRLAFKSSLKLVDKFKNDDIAKFIIRMTEKSSDLEEKVRIFEDGKIDNIIEIMKVVIMENPDFQLKKEDIVEFTYKNKDKFIITKKDGKFEMDFIEELYQNLYDKYIAFIDVKEVSQVDRTWAINMIKSL